MTDDHFNLSRRKALAALGSIGVASAGAGLGTSAYFSDQETFQNNQLTAGTLDMKITATEYYSDWSTDEAALAGMAADEESTDIRLPAGPEQGDAMDIALDLNDVETTDGEPDIYEQFVTAISSNENGESYTTVNGGISAAAQGLCGTDLDADGPVIIDIGDVKPGDFGGAQFAFELCDNPGYVWLTGGLEAASENGVTEPEADDPDEEEDVVELLDEIQVAYGVGGVQTSTAFEDTDAGFQPVEQYTLREFLEMLENGNGLALGGNMDAEDGGGTGEQGCFSGTPDEGSAVHQCSFIWWLPINHGNQVQSDSVTFDLAFYTEQCRHNDGSGMAPVEATVGSGDFSQISYEKAFSMQMLSRGGSGRGEIQIHADSSGVENTTLWGTNPGDTFPADTDVPFTAELDPDAGTASLTVDGETVTDTDITDGSANGSSTGEPEFPSGVPGEVDIAVTASSGKSSVTTTVTDVSVGGQGVTPGSISSTDDLTYLELTDISTSGGATVEGTIRFEGATGDFSGQEFVGVDFR